MTSLNNCIKKNLKLIYIFLITLSTPVTFHTSVCEPSVQLWVKRLVLSVCSSAVPSFKVLNLPLRWSREREREWQGWKRREVKKKKVRKGGKKRRRNDRQETGIDCAKNQDTVFTLRGSTTEKWRHLRERKWLRERARKTQSAEKEQAKERVCDSKRNWHDEREKDKVWRRQKQSETAHKLRQTWSQQLNTRKGVSTH